MQLGKQTSDALVGQQWRDDTIVQISSYSAALEVGYLHPLKGMKRKNLLVVVRDALSGKCLSVDIRYLDHPPKKGNANWVYFKIQELKGRQPRLSDIQFEHREFWDFVGKETLYCYRTMDVTEWKVGDPEENELRLEVVTPHGEMIKLARFGVQPFNPGGQILARINQHGIQCTGVKLWKPKEKLG